MYYHSTILLLFRPFTKFAIIGSLVSPRDVCAHAADAISALVKSYSQLYTLRRIPSFAPYFVLASSITHLTMLGTERSSADQLRQGLADLNEITRCHGLAMRALDVLRFIIRHRDVHRTPEEDTEDLKDIKDIYCSRSSSGNPFSPRPSDSDIVNRIDPAEQDESLLFWPFHVLGKPLFSGVIDVENSGFEITS
jgi:hypothetical protein